MKYLGNNNNIIRTSALSMTNIVASDSVFRVDDDPKFGGGLVSLSGSYTGESDATFEVEIIDNTITGAPSLSNPIFRGVGNGVISALTATADVEAQQVTITLVDLGTETRKAYAPLQGVTIQARDSGPDGNDIVLTIDQSGIVKTESNFALSESLQQGQNEYIGDQWNFGAKVLNPDGTIPSDAPRLAFGDDPQIYRAYKQYVDGRYVYSFSPKPLRNVLNGEKVYIVTGNRSATLTNGVEEDAESYTSIISLYDLLIQIQSDSALAEIIGVVAKDYTPGGMAIDDLSIQTSSYFLNLVKDGTRFVEHASVGLSITSGAPTEHIVIACKDGPVLGAEKWSVYGSVSGDLADAITGTAYSDGHLSFTIPIELPESVSPAGEISGTYLPTGAHGEDFAPCFNLYKPILGAQAVSKSLEFVYVKRPANACDCGAQPITGGPSNDCLGLDEQGGGSVSEASKLIRLQRMASAVRGFIESNTDLPGGVDRNDVRFVKQGASILTDCLQTLIDSGTLALPAWQASHDYLIDEARAPVAANGYRYAVTVAGTSDSSEPTWPVVIGDTVTDGDVTWECIGAIPLQIWDDAFDQFKDDVAGISAANLGNIPTWAPSTSHVSGDMCLPSVFNNHYYLITTIASPGSTGATEPSWPLSGGTVSDQNIIWTDQGVLDFLANYPVDEFFDRYRTMASDILTAAGLDPNFNSASIEGNDCWQDQPDKGYWWVCTDDSSYLPVFTNIYYHSVKLTHDADGNPVLVNTQEFGFAFQFCESDLLPGDTVTVRIEAAGNSTLTYQSGDRIEFDVNYSAPVQLGGGQTGDDTLTWSVLGTTQSFELYELSTVTPNTYDDAGLSFLITPGGINFKLGDSYTFSAEGGQFKYRKDGGDWSDPLDISASETLEDGLSADFTPGSAPSWVAEDRWTFTAEAINGPDQLRQPTDPRAEWEDSTVIEIEPDGDEDVTSVLLCQHTIPSDATIVLQGSDDDFSSTPLEITLTWAEDSIYATFDACSYAKYRITCDRGGAIQWAWLGEPLEMTIRNGESELGKLKKKWRLPGLVRRKGLGATIDHEALTQDSVDNLLSMLSHACEFDEQRFAVIPNDNEATEASLVRYAQDSLDPEDELSFQPRDKALRLIKLSMILEPTP